MTLVDNGIGVTFFKANEISFAYQKGAYKIAITS